MKQFTKIAVVCALAVSLAACGSSASSTAASSAASSEAASSVAASSEAASEAASSEAASSEAAASSAAAQESTIASTRQERAGPFLPFLCARLHPGHECAILKEKTTGRDNA